MRQQTHKVELTSEERQMLETLVRKGEHSALKLMRAHSLAEKRIATVRVGRMRESPRRLAVMHKRPTMFDKRFAAGERLAALERKPQSRPSHMPKLDGSGEATVDSVVL